MSIGPTIENLRKKRAEEAALLNMLYALPTPTGGFDVNTPAERRQLAEIGLRGGEPYSDGRMDYGRQRPVQETIDVMPQQPAEYYAREVSRDLFGERATNDLFGYPQGTGNLVGDILTGGGMLGAIGATAPLTAWDAGAAAARGDYGDAALKSAFSLLEGAGLGELATGARGLRTVANEFPEAAQEVGQKVRGFLADESGSLPLPFKADDPAQARGAQIIDMLTSGRAGEITDEMLDMGDPVMNTRLNEYLFRNYDLPMDEASRMARAQERFNRDVYRGGVSGEIIGNPKSSTQYFAYEPEIATEYALNRTDAGNGDFSGATVGRFMVSAQDRAQGDDVFDAYERITGLGRNSLEYDRSWVPMHYDYTGTPVVEAVESSLKRDGYDSVFFADDAAPMSGVEHDTLAILDPRTNVRSRFARFDPRLAHLRNLSAGVAGGVPLGLMSMPTDEEQYR